VTNFDLYLSGNKGLKKILVALFPVFSLFLVTLQSYYFYQIGVSVFPVLGAGIIFSYGYLTRKQHLADSLFLFCFCCFLFFLYFSVFSFLGYSDWKKIIASFVSFASLLGVVWVFNDSGNLIYRVLSVLIVVHLGFYFFQIAYWFLGGGYVDLLMPVTGEVQRYHSLKGADFGGGLIPRFTGLFNEPGTFSSYLFSIIALRAIVGDKYDFLYYVSAVAIAINFSLYGIIFSAVLFTLPMLKGKRFNVRAFLLVGVAASFFFVWFFPEINERLNSDYSGLDGRVDALEMLSHSETFLYGRSVLGLSDEAADAGILVTMLLHGGIIEVFIFFLVFLNVFRLQCLPGKIFMGALLVSKIKVTYPFLWVVLALLFVSALNKQRAGHSS
jgi:hypothetical protein